MSKIYWKMFAKRCLICYFVLIFFLFLSILRIAKLTSSNYQEVQLSYSSIKLKICDQRGTIFDCNGYPLTNRNKKIIACVSPTPRAITAISCALNNTKAKSVLETLQSGKPAICEVEKPIDCDGIVCTEIYQNDGYIPAVHTLGYCDGENKGVNGIEKAYDSVLYSNTPLSVRFASDGKGRVLQGVKAEIIDDISPLSFGVVTTIDINIQNILETEAKNINRGAIIVADAQNSKIRGIVSAPAFNKNNIKDLLSDTSSPLFNRTLGAYNVGSVFKLCVAAAGIENGNENYKYKCTGKVKIIDRSFKCHNKSGHGLNDLSHAIAQSCNTYFYNFGIKNGKNAILRMADNLNFGKPIRLCTGITAAAGVLPTSEKLGNIAHLANFSIGQGDFTASPIALLPLYSAIANDGKYYMPSIIEGTTKNGKLKKYDYGYKTAAFSKTTADKLKNALKLVVSEGTGVLAKPETVTAAGKTATAQTGKYKNKKEIKSSWFCGYFPADNPKYVAVVFIEDSTLSKYSAAEIFKNIADKTNNVYKLSDYTN